MYAQGIAQFEARLVQLGLAVADRAVEHGGNLIMFITFHIVKDKDEAITGRQIVDGALEGAVLVDASLDPLVEALEVEERAWSRG
jgi:hypothetical protein